MNEAISRLSVILPNVSERAYKPVGDRYAITSPSPVAWAWSAPAQALDDAANRTSQSIFGYISLARQDALDSVKSLGVWELSYLTSGTSAAVFEARSKTPSDLREVVRFGPTGFMMNTPTSDDRAWNPFVVQPTGKATVRYGGIVGVHIERLPMTKVNPPEITDSLARDVKDILNRQVLAGTPYVVHLPTDLSVLPGGKLVYVDPGNLNFRDNSVAKAHAAKQFDPAFQQQTLATIHGNLEAHGLTEGPFGCVVKKSDGSFACVQDNLFAEAEPPSRPKAAAVPVRAAATARA